MEEREGRISFRVLFFPAFTLGRGVCALDETKPGKRSKSLFSYRFIGCPKSPGDPL